jgi:hypothetical protein
MNPASPRYRTEFEPPKLRQSTQISNFKLALLSVFIDEIWEEDDLQKYWSEKGYNEQ